MKCCKCPHYVFELNYNRCNVTENECFYEQQHCDLVNDDGSINYDADYFSDNFENNTQDGNLPYDETAT